MQGTFFFSSRVEEGMGVYKRILESFYCYYSYILSDLRLYIICTYKLYVLVYADIRLKTGREQYVTRRKIK